MLMFFILLLALALIIMCFKKAWRLHKEARLKEAEKPKAIKQGLDLLIKYPTSDGDREERKITVYGLGKYYGSHYIIAYCHTRKAKRTFTLDKFRGCVDMRTGQHITKVKAHILAYNPYVADLTDEFESLQDKNTG